MLLWTDITAPCPHCCSSSRSSGGSKGPGTKAFYEVGRRHQDLSGRAGGMGEFTRRPGEPGSMYGTSVFVDEYAAQQTQHIKAATGSLAQQQ
jgi:hypothetical protein